MSWNGGMTYEQVLDEIYRTKGQPVVVPDGFLNCLRRLNSQMQADKVTCDQLEAELWRRLFAQLDRIESSIGPRTIPSTTNTVHQKGT